jgi:hypothetical protein
MSEELKYDNLIAGDAKIVTEPITIGASQTILRGDLLEKLVTEAITSTGGVEAVKATGTITVTAEAGAVTVGVDTFTYAAESPAATEFTTADQLAQLIDVLAGVNATVAGNVITVTAAVAGVAGNAIALATTQASGTVSAATLTGGAAATAIASTAGRTVAETYVRPSAVANDISHYVVAAEAVTTGVEESAVIIGYKSGEFNEASMRFGGSSTAAQNKEVLADKSIYLKAVQA